MASKENIATVNGKDLPISTKYTIEISNFIRGKNLLKSKAFLNDVILKKKAVPLRRYQGDVGHKRGIGSGRYPVNSAKIILKLLESLEVNAQNKGLDTASLFIKEIIPNKASNVWRYGRQRRRRRKLTHLFILTEEVVKKKRAKEKAAEDKKEAPKEVKEVPKDKKEAPKEVKEAPKEVKKEKINKEESKKPKKEEPKKVEKQQEVKK